MTDSRFLRNGVLTGVILLIISGMTPLGIAWAQEQPVEERYTFVLVGLPLNEALNVLIDETDIELVFETELTVGQITYCRASQQPVEEILRCILEGTGLDFIRLSSGVYVLTRKPELAPRFGSVTGLVLDQETGEPLPNASIVLLAANTGTATNAAGRFVLNQLRPGRHLLAISHVAYETRADSIDILPDASQSVRIAMEPRIVMTAPVVVTGLNRRLPAEKIVDQSIDAAGLQGSNALATGATLNALETIVGVHVGNALEDVHVQGGDAGDHNYQLDGATVFVPIRNGGFFGPFSPFAIEHITVQKAGFEAKHGSFLSGAVQIKHELNPGGGQHAVVQVDPLAVNGRFNGTLNLPFNMKASWMASGRTSLWSLLQPSPLQRRLEDWSQANTFISQTYVPNGTPLSGLASQDIRMGFQDLHVAGRIQLSETKSFSGSLYLGENEFGLNELNQTSGKDAYDWENQTMQVRYEWVHGSRILAHVGVWRSEYKLRHPFDSSPFSALPSPGAAIVVSDDHDEEDEIEDDFNEIKETGFRAGFDAALGQDHLLAVGLEGVSLESEFSLSIDPAGFLPPITEGAINPVTWQMQGFVEDAISLSYRATLTIGTRATFIPSQARLYAEPRASFRLDSPSDARRAWALRLAAGVYRQYISQFDVAPYNPRALLNRFRFWMPLAESVHPSTAYHMAGSFLWIPSEGWELEVESYYKFHPHVLVLDYAHRASATSQQYLANDVLASARGETYGLGLSLRRQVRRLRMVAGYEWTSARRRIPGRFAGRTMPVPWEVPHQLRMSIDYKLGNHLTTTVRLTSLLDRTWGYRQAYYDYLEPDPALTLPGTINLSTPNLDKLPAFYQWDIGLAYTQSIGRINIQARVNMLNVGNRSNTLDWVVEEGEAGNFNQIARHATPLFPTASLRISY